jgi:hypothetical protein
LKRSSSPFSILELKIEIQAQASEASCDQKNAPGISSLFVVFRWETGLCQYLPLLDTDHPPIYKYTVSNADLLTDADPQIGCKSLIAPERMASDIASSKTADMISPWMTP